MLIFLSGSRSIRSLNDDMRRRLDNIIAKRMPVVIGDAHGADKAMQDYLKECKYGNVTVYFVGGSPRNNLGNWAASNVPTSSLSGRDFYTEKDKRMAQEAEFGLVVWDGKSKGSINNVLELLRLGKRSVVYYWPEKKFYNVSSWNDADSLLRKSDSIPLRLDGQLIKPADGRAANPDSRV